jgi:hypothetical protein
MMGVRSAPTGGPQRPKGTAIVSDATVREVARHTIRWTSFIVLAVSFIGAIIAFNGSWPTSFRFWEQVSLLALVAGIGLQSFCTLMEWANRKRRFSIQYLGPLTIDVGSTYIGFAPLLVPRFSSGLSRAGLPELVTTILAHAGVVMLALWFAYYPEQNLVAEE